MNALKTVLSVDSLAALYLDSLQSILALAARWYVGWQFFKSGLLKVAAWDTTLSLFTDEYHVPLLSPHAAAIAGTAGELMFPVLLGLGLSSRIGALGVFAVNAMAVVSYRHVLFAEGYEAALAQHVLWGSIAAYLLVHGPGRWSLDGWFRRGAAPAGGPDQHGRRAFDTSRHPPAT